MAQSAAHLISSFVDSIRRQFSCMQQTTCCVDCLNWHPLSFTLRFGRPRWISEPSVRAAGLRSRRALFGDPSRLYRYLINALYRSQLNPFRHETCVFRCLTRRWLAHENKPTLFKPSVQPDRERPPRYHISNCSDARLHEF